MKIGVYPGSFNDFHVGHYNIYEKASRIFDVVIVVKMQNPSKSDDDEVLRTPPQVRDIAYSKAILTDFLLRTSKEYNVKMSDITVIRGFRNIDDVKTQTVDDYWLHRINDNFNSIYIECDDKYKNISSSAIKTLEKLSQNFKYLTF